MDGDVLMNLKKRKDAVSSVFSLILVLIIFFSSITSILLWGLPYIESEKAKNRSEAIAGEFSSLDEILQKLATDGADSIRIEDIFNEDGSIDIESSGDKLLLMYSFDEGYEFNVSDLAENQIDIHMSKGQLNDAKVYWFEETTCFLSGTQVLMADGSYKNIEFIKSGDVVLSYDFNKDIFVEDKVEELLIYNESLMYDYYLVLNGNVCVTPNHLFYVNNEWVSAEQIRIGDYLTNENLNEVNIFSVEKEYERKITYDLKLSSCNVYFADGFLVKSDLGYLENALFDIFYNFHNLFTFNPNAKDAFGHNDMEYGIEIDYVENEKYQLTAIGQEVIICFMPGTPVNMADGSYKNIEDIVIGDLVKVFNEETSIVEIAPVVRLQTIWHDNVHEILLSDGKVLKPTANHPFLVSGKGWCTISGLDELEMGAGIIEIGDFLFCLNSKDELDVVEVLDIVSFEGNYLTYNFVDMKYGTFIADDIITHNSAPEKPKYPLVTTEVIQSGDVGETTFIGRGNILFIGSEERFSRGICYTGGLIEEECESETGYFDTGAYSTSISSLSEGTYYRYYAVACNRIGCSFGLEQYFLTKPAALLSFSATADTDQVMLSWTHGTGGDKVYIEYSQDSEPIPWNKGSGTIVPGGDLGIFSGTSTIHTGLSSNSVYYYKAWSIANDRGQESDGSNAKPYGAASTASAILDSSNNPPNPPSLTGSYNVYYNDTLYSFIAAPSGGGGISSYNFSWGDGTYIEGGSVQEHSWSQAGIYEIRAKAIDGEGLQSDWSEPLVIQVKYTVRAPLDEEMFASSFFEDLSGITGVYPISTQGIHALKGTVRIDLYNNNYPSTPIGLRGRIPFGRIWIFDLGHICHTYQSNNGFYKTMFQNGGVVKITPSSRYLQESSNIYESGSSTLVCKVTQIRGDGATSGSGTGNYKFQLHLLNSFVAESQTSQVCNLKLKIIGSNQDLWYTYLTFAWTPDFTEQSGSYSDTLLYKNGASTKLACYSSIIRVNILDIR